MQLLNGFYMECFDKNKNLGKDMTWKERLDTKKDVCEDLRRVPIECMPGIGCDKGGLKTINDLKIKTIAVEERGDMEGFEGEDSDVLVQLPGVKTSRRSLRTALEQDGSHMAPLDLLGLAWV